MSPKTMLYHRMRIVSWEIMSYCQMRICALEDYAEILQLFPLY